MEIKYRIIPYKILQILEITQGGPCDGHDIRCDDILTHIDQHCLTGQTLEGLLFFVLGQEGSEATLTLKRGARSHSATRPNVFQKTINISLWTYCA